MPRPNLTLDNATQWCTRSLRKFALAGMRAKGIDHLVVEVRYGKGFAHGGCAWLTVIRLTLPGPQAIERAHKMGRGAINLKELAQVFEHEVDHTLGLTHADMLDWWLLEPTWQDGISIDWKGPTPWLDTADEKASRRAAARSARLEWREAHARNKLAEWETKLRRAKTHRDKWKKKVRYYERKRAGQ